MYIGNDKTVGKKTCKDVSHVDYFLLSSDAFPAIKYLIFWTIIHYFLMSIADLVSICIQMLTKILLFKIYMVLIQFILNGVQPNKRVCTIYF